MIFSCLNIEPFVIDNLYYRKSNIDIIPFNYNIRVRIGNNYRLIGHNNLWQMLTVKLNIIRNPAKINDIMNWSGVTCVNYTYDNFNFKLCNRVIDIICEDFFTIIAENCPFFLNANTVATNSKQLSYYNIISDMWIYNIIENVKIPSVNNTLANMKKQAMSNIIVAKSFVDCNPFDYLIYNNTKYNIVSCIPDLSDGYIIKAVKSI